MVTIYLHIGTHKTGTTSLQKFLFDNREVLKNKDFLYPLTGTSRHSRIRHNNLFVQLTNHKSYEPFEPQAGGWEELITEIESSKCQNIILSSEDFCHLDSFPTKITAIKDYLSSYEVKIIIYLRNQPDYFKSHYYTEVQLGDCWKYFEEYFIDKQRRGYYYERLEPWKKSFGVENIIVKLYDDPEIKNNLIKYFLKTIGCTENNLKFHKTTRQNVSTSPKVIKVMRLLNSVMIAKLKISKEKCRKLYLNKMYPTNKISKIISKIPNFIINEELISEKTKININKKFRNSNEKI